MNLIGITGGIGMGKSTSAKILRERGIPVIDTDQIAREIVAVGQPAFEEIRSKFGSEVIDSDGSLFRTKLAEIVFKSETARRDLEAILHPKIRNCWLERVGKLREDRYALAVVVIPLLFETGAQNHFNAVICVACKADTQLHRLRNRAWSDEHIQQRLSAQWTVERKMELSNYIVWTEGELEIHRQQLMKIIAIVTASPIL